VAIPVGSCHKFYLSLAVAEVKRRLQGAVPSESARWVQESKRLSIKNL
jgi:hypothetical protein